MNGRHIRRFVVVVACATAGVMCAAYLAQPARSHSPTNIYYTCTELDVDLWSFPVGQITIHAKVTKGAQTVFDSDVPVTIQKTEVSEYGLLRVTGINLAGVNRVETRLSWSTAADGAESKTYSDLVDLSSCAPPVQTVTVTSEVPVVQRAEVPVERTVTVTSPTVTTTVPAKTRTVTRTVRVKVPPKIVHAKTRIVHAKPKVIVRTVYRTVPTTPRTVTVTVPGNVPPCRKCQPKVAG